MNEVFEVKIGSLIRRCLLAAISLGATVLAACSGEPQTRASSTEELATVAAGELAASFGVIAWKVRAEGATARVVGSDEQGARKVEMILQRANDDRVDAEVLFPESGTIQLARGGVVSGAPSDLLQRLGAAVNADLGERSVAITSSSSRHGSIAGLTQDPAALFQGEISMGWSMFGYSRNVVVGGWCPPPSIHDRYDAFANGSASCYVNWWMTNYPSDCRINLRMGIPGWQSDTCNWFVYARQP